MTAQSSAARLLMLSPLWLTASDLRSGIAVSFGIAAALGLLTATTRLTRTTADSAFGLALWSTLAAAVSSWVIAAGLAPAPGVVAAVPLAVASFAVWPRIGHELVSPATIAPPLCLPIALGALRDAADVLQRDALSFPPIELLSWLASPGGLLIFAALAAALLQALRHRPAPPAQDPPTA